MSRWHPSFAAYLVTWLLAVTANSAAVAQIVRYVDDHATGGDGESWAGAYRFLQDALSDPTATEIRVAGGVYRPDQGASVTAGDRGAVFALSVGLTLKGGYRGLGGGGDPNDRDQAAFESVLSGDLTADDGPNFANNGENSFHVVRTSGPAGQRDLDGFTITGGNANGSGEPGDGGGLLHKSGSLKVSGCRLIANRASRGGGLHAEGNTLGLELVDCSILDNAATTGGGMQTYSVFSSLTNCIVAGNSAINHGGGHYSRWGGGDLTDCTLSQNTALRGGGAYASGSDLEFRDCAFRSNLAGLSVNQVGGAAYVIEGATAAFVRCAFEDNHASAGGAVAALYANIDVTVQDCSFVGCSARNGGALALGTGTPLVERSLFLANSADSGGAISNSGGSNALFRNCWFLGNTATGPLGGGALTNSAAAAVSGCFFSGNQADVNGGAVRAFAETASTTLLNCTLSGNVAGGEGGGIHVGHFEHSVPIGNSILWNNQDAGGMDDSAQITAFPWYAVQVDYSRVQGWTATLPGTATNGNSPLLFDAFGEDNLPGTADDDPRLHFASTCINSGDPAFTATNLPTDIDGHARTLCDRVEIGADEFGFGDFDCNRMVNLADFASWPACASGPATASGGVSCVVFDWNSDQDIDLYDFAALQSSFGLQGG